MPPMGQPLVQLPRIQIHKEGNLCPQGAWSPPSFCKHQHTLSLRDQLLDPQGHLSIVSSSTVLVCSGYHNKPHRPSGLNKRNIFPPSSGVWKSEIRVPAQSSSVEDPLPGFLLFPHTMEGVIPFSLFFSFSLLRRQSWGPYPHDLI